VDATQHTAHSAQHTADSTQHTARTGGNITAAPRPPLGEVPAVLACAAAWLLDAPKALLLLPAPLAQLPFATPFSPVPVPVPAGAEAGGSAATYSNFCTTSSASSSGGNSGQTARELQRRGRGIDCVNGGYACSVIMKIEAGHNRMHACMHTHMHGTTYLPATL